MTAAFDRSCVCGDRLRATLLAHFCSTRHPFASVMSDVGEGLVFPGQRYDAAGNTLGGEFQINSYTTLEQYRPTVATDADGDFVAVWTSVGQDGSGTGVFAQRFAGPGLHLSVSGACGGEVTVDIAHAVPNTEVGIVRAANRNGFVKGGAQCNGTVFEIGEPFLLPLVWVFADANGEASVEIGLPAGRGCGEPVQSR